MWLFRCYFFPVPVLTLCEPYPVATTPPCGW